MNYAGVRVGGRVAVSREMLQGACDLMLGKSAYRGSHKSCRLFKIVAVGAFTDDRVRLIGPDVRYGSKVGGEAEIFYV